MARRSTGSPRGASVITQWTSFSRPAPATALTCTPPDADCAVGADASSCAPALASDTLRGCFAGLLGHAHAPPGLTAVMPHRQPTSGTLLGALPWGLASEEQQIHVGARRAARQAAKGAERKSARQECHPMAWQLRGP
eukprot:CAMPEP_0119355276 /NCGR_PEP_ID=MMETSP1334-20130426/4126_1 /TAXON_ID=127549 /ORGANISM="Calcidiscus leptoporus, Strain RCC1130" /LENGTH=137 /DNA_ID=CAMNT_0007369049 /DNA_START=561 /DNA_END=974 /DNA_ORIENTATION=-